MSIENKPAERLIKAFAEGRFDPSVDEIFAPVAPMTTTTTIAKSPLERLKDKLFVELKALNDELDKDVRTRDYELHCERDKALRDVVEWIEQLEWEAKQSCQ